MTERAEQHGISYASAGVDIEAGDRAVELFKPLAQKATRPEVRGGLGGFAVFSRLAFFHAFFSLLTFIDKTQIPKMNLS